MSTVGLSDVVHKRLRRSIMQKRQGSLAPVTLAVLTKFLLSLAQIKRALMAKLPDVSTVYRSHTWRMVSVRIYSIGACMDLGRSAKRNGSDAMPETVLRVVVVGRKILRTCEPKGALLQRSIAR
jgi:hypothetical protein